MRKTRTLAPRRAGVLLAAALVLLPAAAAATEITFLFAPPPEATRVSVAGAFNDWNVSADPMSDPDGDGIWTVVLDLPPGTHPYKFVVDGTTWITDETADDFVDDGFGGRNSLLTVGEEPMTVGPPARDPDGSGAPLPSGTEVVFRFEAARDAVNSVSVAGTFNDWNAAADVLSDPDGDGIWEATVRVEPGLHRYQFVVDGDTWVGAPYVAETEEDGFGGRNGLVTVGAEPLSVGTP